jgi:hypothetical protein
MAVDGDANSFWKTARAKGKNKLPSEWLRVDLGQSSTIGKVVLEWDANYAREYTIEVSADDANWNTVFATTSGNGSIDTITFSPVSSRYVRMVSTAWSSGSLRNWLQELEVYTSGGSEPTPTPSPTPTSTPTPTAIPTPTATPTPPPGASTMHAGDLAGSSSASGRNRWDAAVSILVHDENENPLSDVTISGSWSNGASGSSSCVTDASGMCTLLKKRLKSGVSGVTFTLNGLSHASIQYEPLDNHDPEGDGTSIQIAKP